MCSFTNMFYRNLLQVNNSKHSCRKMSLINLLILLVVFITSVQSCGPGRGLGGPRKNRKLTPLVFKQHVPNLLETTLGASGLAEGKINRDDPRFLDLVPNYNRDIIFKDEEGTGADRLMTQRCKERLNTLAVSVMNQWPGIKLRVTESWDEDDLHGSGSLHYEGRAVDITTSDRDRTKYGMLARLAVEAGFDWVYYESRAHIHCSVKSDSTAGPYESGCFTGDSTVMTSTGAKRKLSELELGEKVQSMDKSGNVIFSEVLMFLDRDTIQKREFVHMKIDGGAELTVTPAHLVMVWNPNKNLSKFTFADKIEEDDFVLVNLNNTLEPRRVVHVSVVFSQGAYAPLTKEGTIIVDSVAASCYALVDSQEVAHWSFLPVRTLNSISHWFSDRAISARQEGVHWYANALYTIKNYILPSDWIHH